MSKMNGELTFHWNPIPLLPGWQARKKSAQSVVRTLLKRWGIGTTWGWSTDSRLWFAHSAPAGSRGRRHMICKNLYEQTAPQHTTMFSWRALCTFSFSILCATVRSVLSARTTWLPRLLCDARPLGWVRGKFLQPDIHEEGARRLGKVSPPAEEGGCYNDSNTPRGKVSILHWGSWKAERGDECINGLSGEEVEGRWGKCQGFGCDTEGEVIWRGPCQQHAARVRRYYQGGVQAWHHTTQVRPQGYGGPPGTGYLRVGRARAWVGACVWVPVMWKRVLHRFWR